MLRPDISANDKNNNPTPKILNTSLYVLSIEKVLDSSNSPFLIFNTVFSKINIS